MPKLKKLRPRIDVSPGRDNPKLVHYEFTWWGNHLNYSIICDGMESDGVKKTRSFKEVTCPYCLASDDYKQLVRDKLYEELSEVYEDARNRRLVLSQLLREEKDPVFQQYLQKHIDLAERKEDKFKERRSKIWRIGRGRR